MEQILQLMLYLGFLEKAKRERERERDLVIRRQARQRDEMRMTIYKKEIIVREQDQTIFTIFHFNFI
jgi:hypothetical protein